MLLVPTVWSNLIFWPTIPVSNCLANNNFVKSRQYKAADRKYPVVSYIWNITVNFSGAESSNSSS